MFNLSIASHPLIVLCHVFKRIRALAACLLSEEDKIFWRVNLEIVIANKNHFLQ